MCAFCAWDIPVLLSVVLLWISLAEANRAQAIHRISYSVSVRSSFSQSWRNFPSIARKSRIVRQACKTVVWSRQDWEKLLRTLTE